MPYQSLFRIMSMWWPHALCPTNAWPPQALSLRPVILSIFYFLPNRILNHTCVFRALVRTDTRTERARIIIFESTDDLVFNSWTTLTLVCLIGLQTKNVILERFPRQTIIVSTTHSSFHRIQTLSMLSLKSSHKSTRMSRERNIISFRARYQLHPLSDPTR